MSRPVSIVCDECGRVKQESNHWWQIKHGPLILVRLENELPVIDGEIEMHLCSEACVIATVSKYLRGELKP